MFCVMNLIFILYNFSMVDVDAFSYKHGQTLQSLTSDRSYMRSKKDRREGVPSFTFARRVHGNKCEDKFETELSCQ